MEEKTAEGASSQSGCFFCTMLPLIERRWTEATAATSRTRASSS